MFLVLALGLFQTSFAQCKKNVILNEIDEFTGYKKVIIGDEIALVHTLVGTKCKNCNMIGRIAICKIDENYSVRLHLFHGDVWSVSPGNTVEIKFMDGTVDNFVVENSMVADKRSGDKSIVPWHGVVFFVIPKEFLSKLQEVELDKLRVEFNDQLGTARISRKKQVMEWANCIEKM